LAALEVAARQKAPAAQVQADVSQIQRLPNVSYVVQELLYRALGGPGRRLAQEAGRCPGGPAAWRRVQA
jgi:hypothetical protein